MNDLHPAAVAAANWWAEQIGAPTFRNVADSSSAEDRALGDMAGMMQTLIAERHPVSETQGRLFAAVLARDITDRLARTEYGVSLGVDYGPDATLATPAEAAGVSLSRFPWKTNMWVKETHVTVSAGYRGANVLLWSAPDWERPTCHSVDYDEVKRTFVDRLCGKPMYHAGGHGDWGPDDRRCDHCGLSMAGHYNRDHGDAPHMFEVTR